MWWIHWKRGGGDQEPWSDGKGWRAAQGGGSGGGRSGGIIHVDSRERQEREFQVVLSGKESCQCRRCKRCGFDPWVRKIPWRRKWQPLPVVLPGKSHGQRSLAGYSPWAGKESDMTERLSTKHTAFLNGLLWRYWHRISYKLRGNWSDRSQWLTRAGAPSPPHGGKPGCHLCPRARTLQIPHPDFFLLPSISLPFPFCFLLRVLWQVICI